MKKLVLTKEIVKYVDQLGWNDYTQKEPSFEEKAKRALEGFHSSRWNSGYIKFIAENLEKIERAAQGEEAIYPVMTIYKNVKTGELEAEDCSPSWTD